MACWAGDDKIQLLNTNADSKTASFGLNAHSKYASGVGVGRKLAVDSLNNVRTSAPMRPQSGEILSSIPKPTNVPIVPGRSSGNKPQPNNAPSTASKIPHPAAKLQSAPLTGKRPLPLGERSTPVSRETSEDANEASRKARSSGSRSTEKRRKAVEKKLEVIDIPSTDDESSSDEAGRLAVHNDSSPNVESALESPTKRIRRDKILARTEQFEKVDPKYSTFKTELWVVIGRIGRQVNDQWRCEVEITPPDKMQLTFHPEQNSTRLAVGNFERGPLRVRDIREIMFAKLDTTRSFVAFTFVSNEKAREVLLSAASVGEDKDFDCEANSGATNKYIVFLGEHSDIRKFVNELEKLDGFCDNCHEKANLKRDYSDMETDVEWKKLVNLFTAGLQSTTKVYGTRHLRSSDLIRGFHVEASGMNLSASSWSTSASIVGVSPHLTRATRSSTRGSRHVSAISRIPIGQLSEDSQVMFVYPMAEDAQGALTVLRGDHRRVTSREFLNDVLIDFQIKRAIHESGNIEKDSIHVFTSLFYTKLCEAKDAQSAYEKVQRWTKNVDLFQLELVLVPVNIGLHWSLAAILRPGQIKEAITAGFKTSQIRRPPKSQTRSATKRRIIPSDDESDCAERALTVEIVELDSSPRSEEVRSSLEDGALGDPPGDMSHLQLPCILLLDSLSIHSAPTIGKKLRSYLCKEWANRKDPSETDLFTSDKIPIVTCQVPMQGNSYDCGMFVSKFAIHLLKSRPTSFIEDITSKFSRFINPTMFSQADVDIDRHLLAEDLVKLSREFESQRKELRQKLLNEKRKQAEAESLEGSEKGPALPEAELGADFLERESSSSNSELSERIEDENEEVTVGPTVHSFPDVEEEDDTDDAFAGLLARQAGTDRNKLKSQEPEDVQNYFDS